MTELFVILTVIFLGFVVWYVKDKIGCDLFGHEFEPDGYIFMCFDRDEKGRTRAVQCQNFVCIRCGKKLF